MQVYRSLFTFLIIGCTSSEKSVQNNKSTTDPDLPCENTFSTHDFTVEQIEEAEFSGKFPPREEMLPDQLSELSLYSDIISKDIHPAIQNFTPQFQLWSDGAEKKRWVYIPECDTIDSTDINDWHFPVGTRFFKEFSIDGKLVETRYIERIGVGDREYLYASYAWNEDETEATRAPEDGLINARGTGWAIPSKMQCLQCHGTYPTGGGRPSRGLGFSALQLNHTRSGLDVDWLLQRSNLQDSDFQSAQFPEEHREVLGYFHANCGNCHNATSDRIPQIDLDLWVDVGTTSFEGTALWQSAVNQDLEIFHDQHVEKRIVSGVPDESAILYRMKQRGNNAQMPPVGTALVDEEGVALIRNWIEGIE